MHLMMLSAETNNLKTGKVINFVYNNYACCLKVMPMNEWIEWTVSKHCMFLLQETSILEEYNINWTQKLGAGISGPVRYVVVSSLKGILKGHFK